VKSPQPSKGIVDRALDLINPKPEQETACAAATEARLQLLRDCIELHRNLPSPGDLKKELSGIRRDLTKAKKAISSYSPAARAMIFKKDAVAEQQFFDSLDRLAADTQFFRASLVVRPGGHRWDNRKVMAARYGADLLRSYSTEPFTKTGKACRELAELLWEGASGKVEDLAQYCREPDRIDPPLVVKVPWAKR
jgi:hypothetical protein